MSDLDLFFCFYIGICFALLFFHNFFASQEYFLIYAYHFLQSYIEKDRSIKFVFQNEVNIMMKNAIDVLIGKLFHFLTKVSHKVERLLTALSIWRREFVIGFLSVCIEDIFLVIQQSYFFLPYT